MGLHQLQSGPQNASSPHADQVDRCKVLRSLYLRDKKLALQRGCACWLPLHDCTLPTAFGLEAANDALPAHLQLASVQNDLYKLIHAANARRQSPHKTSRLLARINQSLDELSRAPLWTDQGDCSIRNNAFKLDFLTSRISAASFAMTDGYSEAMLGDAIASCLFLLAGCGQHDDALATQLSRLLPRDLGAQQETNVTALAFARSNPSQPPALHASLVSFSLRAFFLLAKQLMPGRSGLETAEKEAILAILHRVAACYKGNQPIFESQNLCRNLGNVFQQVLQIVSTVQSPPESEEATHSSSSEEQSLGQDALSLAFTSGDVDNASGLALPSSDPWTSPMNTSWDMSFLNDVSMGNLGLDDAFTRPFPDDVNEPLHFAPQLY